MFGMQIGRLGRVDGRLSDAQKILALFKNGEQGFWLDPSDLSTLFQDAAGTTPVTAVEQHVGLMLDLSGRGNHASMATTTKRPAYSRRVNLLTKTEQFDDAAVWARFSSGTGSSPTLTPGFIAPDGTNTAWRLQLNRGPGISASDFSILRQATSDTQAKQRKVWIKSNTAEPQTLSLVATLSSDIVTAGLDWAQVTGGSNSAAVQLDFSNYGTVPTSQVVDVLIWHPEMVPVQDAHLPYQWVNTDTDYDADPAKFPAYLRFDGVDDALQTGNIDFTGTDKMTVWAGVDRTPGSTTGVIVGTSGNAFYSDGAFALFAHGTLGYEFASRGTVLSDTVFNSSPPASPSTVVASFDIGGSSVVHRVNSQQSAITANQGTGQYGNYPLYIGALSTSSIYLNGRLYSLIVRGAQSSLSQIEATEAYVKQKMRLP